MSSALKPVDLAISSALPLFFLQRETQFFYNAIQAAIKAAKQNSTLPPLSRLQDEAWQALRHELREPLERIRKEVFDGSLDGCAGPLAPLPRVTPATERGITYEAHYVSPHDGCRLLASNILDSGDSRLQEELLVKRAVATLSERWKQSKVKVESLVKAAKEAC